MNIYFDVDLTLISELGELRPLVTETFRLLVADGHTLYLWSGNGIRWPVVDRHGLREYVSGCFYKPLYNHRNALERQGVAAPDFCVDDLPDCIEEFGGVVVAAYGEANPVDREMARVYEAVRLAQQLSGGTT